METFIFNSVADVAVMTVLVVFCFCETLAGTVFIRDWSKDAWYQTGAKRVWLIPPWYIFPIVWPILYVLIITSLYIFYRSVTLNDAFGQTVDVITLLFIFNMFLNKLWSPIFFRVRSPILAWWICAGCLATGIAMLYYFYNSGYTDSFWTFLFYVVWTAFALVLNTMWVWKNRNLAMKKTKMNDDTKSEK